MEELNSDTVSIAKLLLWVLQFFNYYATYSNCTFLHTVLPFDTEEADSPAVTAVDEDDSYSLGTGGKVNVTWNERAVIGELLSGYTATINISMVIADIIIVSCINLFHTAICLLGGLY